MTICSLASEAVSGLSSGAGGSLINTLGNVLGVLGAADIGIQIGTGGQAGLGDLPGMFNVPGIECVDPDTGEVTLVSPAQWYGNGMSCAGLRNPDSDRLKREQEDFEQRMRNREAIRRLPFPIPSQQIVPLPTGMQSEIVEHLQQLSTPSGGGGILFDYDGVLKQSCIATITRQWSSVSPGGNFRVENRYDPVRNPSAFPTYSVTRGSSLQTRRPPESNYSGIFSQFALSFFLGNSTRALFYAGITVWTADRSGLDIFGRPFGAFEARIDSADTSFSFIPSGGGGGTGGGEGAPSSIPPLIIPPRNPDPRDPCNDGRRRRQPMACGQCKLTPQLIKQIQEIHKVLGAPKLVSGYRYNPEKELEGWGKQLYKADGSQNAQGVKPSTILDVISATATAPYYRLGLQRFPAEVPETLINKNTGVTAIASQIKTKKLQDLSSFLEWTFLAIEEVLGEWPIKFEITDDNKTKKVDVWNIAEALGEIFGMQIKVVEDSDQGVQWGVRAATEASKSGNAALKVLHLLQELVDFSGGIKSQGTITVDCTFTPDPTVGMTTEEMLKPSKQTLIVTNIQDGRSLLGLLLNINYWSQIAGRANFQTLKNNPQTGKMQLPGDLIKEAKKEKKIFNKSFDEWKKKRQQPNTNIPNSEKPRGLTIPDIKVIEMPDKKL